MSDTILEHVGFVGHCVNLIPRSDIQKIGGYDDAFQLGVIGLLKALPNHNPELGKFTSYAYPYVLGEIRRAVKKANRWYRSQDFYNQPKRGNVLTLPLDELNLNRREKTVLFEHFWQNKTFDEIGRESGLSRQRVHQIQKRALAKLQSQLSKV